MNRRHWTRGHLTLGAGALLLVALTVWIVREIRSAQHEIDLILDEGVAGLDRSERVLQTLLDLRAGVLGTLLDASDADRLAAAKELTRLLDVLDRQNDQLAELELRRLLHEDESDELKRLIDLAEESVAQVIAQSLEPGGDLVLSVRSATAVSTQIDACATELHELSTRVAARARISDSEIPEALQNAEHLTLALAGLALVLGLVAADRRRRAAPAVPDRWPPPPDRDRRLRIVHVLTHLDATRGGAIQALLLAREQWRAGHDVRVVANCIDRAAPIDATFAAWQRQGIEFRLFEMRDPQGTTCPPREIVRFRRYLAKQRFDVVHVHRDKALLFALAAASGLGVPAFVSQRGTTHRFRHRIVALAHRSRRVHRIIAVAEAVKRSLVEQRVASERVDVVYGSFDVDRFDPATVDGSAVRRELGAGDDAKIVLVLGELNLRKDPATFIRAFAKIAERRADAWFVHAGDATDARRRRFHALARELLGERMRFLGWRPDVPELLAAADVVVNAPAADEGLSGAVREALAMARPVVCTATDGNPEVVHHGKTGLLVPARDPGAIAEAVETLLDDPALAASLGAAGRALVLATMSTAARAHRMEEIYRAVLAEREAIARGFRR